MPNGTKNKILFTDRNKDKFCAKKTNTKYKILRLPSNKRLKWESNKPNAKPKKRFDLLFRIKLLQIKIINTKLTGNIVVCKKDRIIKIRVKVFMFSQNLLPNHKYQF